MPYYIGVVEEKDDHCVMEINDTEYVLNVRGSEGKRPWLDYVGKTIKVIGVVENGVLHSIGNYGEVRDAPGIVVDVRGGEVLKRPSSEALKHKEDLLKRKIRVLEQEVRLKDKVISQLDLQVKTGKLPPVGESLTPGHVDVFSQQHADKLWKINLELENIELKERIAQLS